MRAQPRSNWDIVLALAIGLACLAFVFKDCTACAQPALERGDRPIRNSSGSGALEAVASLERALLTRMRLGADHSGPYARSCRRSRGGCEAHVARVVLEMRTAAAHWEIDPWLLAALALRESGLRCAAARLG